MSNTSHAAETALVEIPVTFAASDRGQTLTAEQLAAMPPDAVGVLIDLGFSKALSASKAMTKAKREEIGKDKAKLNAYAAPRAAEIYKSIVAGTFSRRKAGGAQGGSSPLKRVMHTIAIERLRALCATTGNKMPKAEVRKAAIEKILTKQEADIRAEAEVRISASKAASKGLEELFA